MFVWSNGCARFFFHVAAFICPPGIRKQNLVCEYARSRVKCWLRRMPKPKKHSVSPNQHVKTTHKRCSIMMMSALTAVASPSPPPRADFHEQVCAPMMHWLWRWSKTGHLKSRNVLDSPVLKRPWFMVRQVRHFNLTYKHDKAYKTHTQSKKQRA